MLKIREGLVILAVLAVAGGVYAWKAQALPRLDLINGGPAISQQARAHILHGDKNGGGHLYGTGKPCKTEFPKDWDESDIIAHVRNVAANDNLNWRQEKNGYYTATDNVDGVKMRVVLDKERDGVVTAYPLDGKTNACQTRSSGKPRNVRTSRPVNAEGEKTLRNNAAPQKKYNFNR